MDTAFTAHAEDVERQLTDYEYDRLWSVLEKVMVDPEEAKHAGWTSFISSKSWWASKIPGTSYTVFWLVDAGGTLMVVHILEDTGF
ncbi:hypothetical protein [Clavibacter californiensis]|uniref:Uncharacterized protein n=1 Tax=Clavibacter californiensis TaxID=1401995 RepID=A0ABX9N9I4_9MICO|nr:hypothetical protein [Clavibacter californiensis]RII94881.1 hypothetical protein DZF98_00215 [Clavibacter californiensis]UKF81709.1 hypothetical protein FGD68_15210 [Clavibacter californiensis]